jgi:putative hydroxymethylpyrimidine transport system ATP-binding protein
MKSPAISFSGAASVDGLAVFDTLDLSCLAGKWTCLLGPSGVGKTTILRLIAGLPTGVSFSGEIAADDGQKITNRVAYMAQTDLLLPWRDVSENVTLGAALRGERVDQARADQLIDRLGLGPHRHKRPAQLSGGQRQRVALARTLMEDRPIVLLDEPFSALDARLRAELQELFAAELQDRTVLMVTHDPAEAARLGDAIWVMNETGLHSVQPPDSPAIRAVDGAETLAAQARLLQMLREPA